MFSIIKHVFILLLSLTSSLARNQTKCLFSNDKPCTVRPTLTDLDPVELKYYPFMISLDKCTGIFNVFSQKKYVQKETKDT